MKKRLKARTSRSLPIQQWRRIQPITRLRQPVSIQLLLLRTQPALILTKPLMRTLQINTPQQLQQQQQPRLQQQRQRQLKSQPQLLLNTQLLEGDQKQLRDSKQEDQDQIKINHWSNKLL